MEQSIKNNIKAICSPSLSNIYEKRYVIVDKDTGEVLDDAQGYGYKTPQKAYAAWSYKHRDKSKDKYKKAKKQQIRSWMKNHKSFIDDMTQYAFEIECKGSWGPDAKFDAAFVAHMLKDYGLKPDFTAGELLREWKKG